MSAVSMLFGACMTYTAVGFTRLQTGIVVNSASVVHACYAAQPCLSMGIFHSFVPIMSSLAFALLALPSRRLFESRFAPIAGILNVLEQLRPRRERLVAGSTLLSVVLVG